MTEDITVSSQTGPFAMVPLWVLTLGLTGSELATYIALRSFADRAGEAHPRVRTIAERAGVSQSAAERGIRRMRELGIVHTVQMHRPDGSISGCKYTLLDVCPASHMSRFLPGGTGVADGGGTGVADGGVPAPLTEQEHTNEQTKERKRLSPVAGATADAPSERPDVEALCDLLADLIEGNGALRPPITAAWRRDARLLLDKDGRDAEKAAQLIRWALNDPFWRANIMSMPTFRKQFDRLRLQALAAWEAQHRPAASKPNSAESRMRKAADIAARLAAEETPVALGAHPDILGLTRSVL